ncbi:putative inactive poly [ADP-ribose] polymerase SRO5 [Acorus calamus]|uniref:Inactive poly [ADP-ribose] polymerase SRO5 n=1 Tax=Acorus calamus TaxID=4465 RepID=A0AAV9F751_ACOCL|nr:putative inactive poly [ADP-ribose] polymerase SRO5 [Acorus calamus]
MGYGNPSKNHRQPMLWIGFTGLLSKMSVGRQQEKSCGLHSVINIMDLEHGGVEDPVPGAIHENGSTSDSESGSSSKPVINSFVLNSNGLAMSKKCAGQPNIKCAWYGSSVDRICGIVNHGFGPCERPENGGLYGSGAYLSPETSAIDSVVSSIADDNGLRQVLFCRVILGNSEEVRPGSMQYQPSSEEFDSGVDNLLAPKRYIVWSTHMNTCILPQYVLSVKLSFGLRAHDEPVRRPSSAWMPLPALISSVSRLLPPSTGALIKKYHNDFVERKSTRQQLIQRIRQLAGDRLLIAAIKSYRDKQMKLERTHPKGSDGEGPQGIC